MHRHLTVLAIATTLVSFATPLHVVSNSNCSSVCTEGGSSNTLVADVVCNDADFTSTTNGTRFRDCVECELGSTAVESSGSDLGDSDVDWAIYNLRYAFSTCVYGFPIAKQSISTPCQVSCTPLQTTLEQGLNSSVASDSLDYCSNSAFTAAAVTKCATCYNLTGTEMLMSNCEECMVRSLNLRI